MNRASRRKAARELRKAMKSGIGVSARLAGYRVVGPDGRVKLSVGREPTESNRGRSQ